MCAEVGGLGVGAVDDVVAFALAASAEGVVLAEGVCGVVLPEEDSSEVGVVAEADAEHVEDFAFGPFGAWPEVTDGVEVEGRVFVDAARWDGGIEEGFDE